VGVGFAGPSKNTDWVEDQDYEFEVWTDNDKVLALHYGAVDDETDIAPARHTKVLDANGVLLLEYIEGVNPNSHPQDVLDDCQELFGN
jgi:peroxiredoxin